MDADGWRKILTSNHYGPTGADLRKAFAEVIKKMCTEKEEPNNDNTSLEAFLACRLIPLNKNPGLRPIGVGEVLRRIAGKVVMRIVKEDVRKASGGLQMCGGHEAGAEAAVHSMNDIFNQNDTEAVLLVDAENAFNSVNRKVLLHNIQHICPAIYVFIFNCYSVPARLFVIGGVEIRSREGTTQGDPSAMATYALALVPLIKALLEIANPAFLVAFADDITGAGSIEQLAAWWKRLNDYGPKYGYFPKAEKSFLIVKEEHYEKARRIFEGTSVCVTYAGKRHLGAVIGSEEYKEQYINESVDRWVNELQILSEIARIQPQAAYSAYIYGFKSKFTYAMRTIPGIDKHLQRIESVLRHEFIPAITGGHICSDMERNLLALPVKLGGLGIDNICKRATSEYHASRKVTNDLVENIKNQNKVTAEGQQTNQIKNEVKKTRREFYQREHEQIITTMTDKERHQNEIIVDSPSNWLSSIPLEEFDFKLNKVEFWDALHLRYNWPVPNLPSRCACGERFDVQHAMSCKKGGFVTQRHNELRDITARLLTEVCNDVEVEPPLIKLTGEQMRHKTAKIKEEARPDISARSFWVKGQKTFLDIRVFDPNAKRYQDLTIKQSYLRNENEKKRHYNERILNVDQGSFSPLVFSVSGGMAQEAKIFYSRLAEKISEKRKTNKNIVISWLRTKINFALIRSMLICLRGSRSIVRKNIDLVDETIAEVTRKL
jgi:hypothetical protein